MDFRTLARELAYAFESENVAADVYQILAVADRLTNVLGFSTPATLVDVALADGEILGFMAADKRISAIKRLRTLTGASLLEAKNAIWSDKVMAFHVMTGVSDPNVCEHGLSADLCDGPQHYPADNPWDDYDRSF